MVASDLLKWLGAELQPAGEEPVSLISRAMVTTLEATSLCRCVAGSQGTDSQLIKKEDVCLLAGVRVHTDFQYHVLSR